MSVYGTWLAATIPAGSNTSAAIDLGREYDYLLVQLPKMAPCKLHLQVAETEGGTFYDLGNDATTNEESFGRADHWRLGGYRFIKVVFDRTHDSAVAIRVKGMRP